MSHDDSILECVLHCYVPVQGNAHQTHVGHDHREHYGTELDHAEEGVTTQDVVDIAEVVRNQVEWYRQADKDIRNRQHLNELHGSPRVVDTDSPPIFPAVENDRYDEDHIDDNDCHRKDQVQNRSAIHKSRSPIGEILIGAIEAVVEGQVRV